MASFNFSTKIFKVATKFSQLPPVLFFNFELCKMLSCNMCYGLLTLMTALLKSHALKICWTYWINCPKYAVNLPPAIFLPYHLLPAMWLWGQVCDCCWILYKKFLNTPWNDLNWSPFELCQCFSPLMPVSPITARDVPWPFFLFWRHHFWPKLASSILNLYRKKRSFQWCPAQSGRPNGALDMHKNAQKVE